ncbi:hypothetical protein Tco_0827321 [Tanacetum coccineum]
MDTAYARVERLSILGSNINDFVMYCPITGTEALNPLVVSSRSFFDGDGIRGGGLVKVFGWLFAFGRKKTLWGTIQLEEAVSTISGEYLLEFTSEYGIPEDLHPELPCLKETIVDFMEGKVGVYTKFFEFANYRIPLSQFLFDILGDGFVQFDQCPESYESEDRDPTSCRPRGAVINCHCQSGYRHGGGNPPTTEAASDLEPEAATMGSLVRKRRRERGSDGANVNASPKVLRKDHASIRSEQSTHGGKSLTSMGLAADSIFVTPTDAKSVSDPDPLSYAEPQPFPEQEIAQSSEIPTENAATAEVQNLQSTRSLESGKSISVSSMVRSPEGIYDTPYACQDVVDHIVPSGYFFELRHISNADFLGRYNINLAQQVAIGSQLRLRFEQEVRLLKKARAQIARRD